LRILLGGFAVVIGAIGTVVLTIGNESHAGIGLLVAPVILAISLVLFHSLTLRVSRDGVSFAFGPGLIRKKIPLSDIESARAVNQRRLALQRFRLRRRRTASQEWPQDPHRNRRAKEPAGGDQLRD